MEYNIEDVIEAAEKYINSDEFPVIGYPHLAKKDYIKGAEWMFNYLKDKLNKNGN